MASQRAERFRGYHSIMQATKLLFASWACEVEEGMFNASSEVNSERGPTAYNHMGHGDDEDYAAVVAVREMLQNSFDAGATRAHITHLATSETGCLLAVEDNAPPESALSLHIYSTYFMKMDTSFKPGGAAGGKGQARAMLSGLDGLVMAGVGGFVASVGVKYAAALDDSTPLTTYRAATKKQRESLTKLLQTAPKAAEGGMVAVALGSLKCTPRRIAYFLGLCALPSVTFDCIDANGCLTPFPLLSNGPPRALRADPKTLHRMCHPGKLTFTLTIAPQDSTSPYGITRWTAGALTHVRCRGVVMFSRFVVIHDICNSDLLQIIVDVEAADSGLRNSEIFTLQRSDLRSARLNNLSCEALVRIAVGEFEGLLNKPTKFLRSGATAGAPLLKGMPNFILNRLKITSLIKAWGDQRDDHDIRALTSRDRPDPTSKREQLGSLGGGCGFRVEVMINDTGKNVFTPGQVVVPTEHETALVRFCALISAVSVGVAAAQLGRPLIAVNVGALYSDDDSFAGMCCGGVIYVDVRSRMQRFFQQASDVTLVPMFHELLNSLATTTIHETCHSLVDVSQSHSRSFWDLHVALSSNLFLKRTIEFLLRSLTPTRDELRAATCGEDFMSHLVRVLSQQRDEDVFSDDENDDPDWKLSRYQLRSMAGKRQR